MTASSIAFSTPINEDRFTVKLHKLLEDAGTCGFQDIIGWNSDGRSFTIFKPEEFAHRIMKQYFRQSKYKSFQRQLNLYDFRRETRNGLRGFYCHPMFFRSSRAMSSQIRRKNMSKKARQRIEMASQQYPTKEITKRGQESVMFSTACTKGLVLAPILVKSAFPVNLDSELAAILQPVPINKDAMRCYSPKGSQMDDEGSMGTIEGQILNEEDYM